MILNKSTYLPRVHSPLSVPPDEENGIFAF